jgi:hypothetical protein
MNALELWFKNHPIFNQGDCMDLLQNNGIISENCVLAMDVANADCHKAIAFLDGKLENK